MIHLTLHRPFRHPSQRRCISDYLSDVWRTKSLRPTNPLAAVVEPRSSSSSPPLLPMLSSISPHHAANLQPTLTSQLEDCIPLSVSLSELDRCYYRSQVLEKTTTWLWLMNDDARVKLQWSRVIDSIIDNDAHSSSILQRMQQIVDEESDDDQRRVLEHWQRHYQQRTGAGLSDEAVDEYQQLAEALPDVVASIAASRPILTTQLVQDMYSFIGIRSEQAKLLGYANAAEQALETRQAELTEIHQLHATVTAWALESIQAENPVAQDTSHFDGLVDQSGNRPSARPPASPASEDEGAMIRLEQHVTLDGALMFCSHLFGDLLGVELVEDQARAWHKDVRFFHVNEAGSGRTLGSFYLDPFHRANKAPRPMTSVLYPASLTAGPVLGVSLVSQAPAWDTDPAVLNWVDMENLLHELGHVIDCIMTPMPYGSLAGLEAWPLDRSELLPKFMEHWMMEKPTIYALIDMSRSQTGLSDDSIEAAFRVRSRRKALELAQLSYYGSLELHLFSDFDLRGKESILALQTRLAAELVPHDMPANKSVGPLLEILQENASGRPVAWYRYLWCDAASAETLARIKKSHGTATKQVVQEMVKQELLSGGEQSSTVGTRALLERYRLP